MTIVDQEGKIITEGDWVRVQRYNYLNHRYENSYSQIVNINTRKGSLSLSDGTNLMSSGLYSSVAQSYKLCRFSSKEHAMLAMLEE